MAEHEPAPLATKSAGVSLLTWARVTMKWKKLVGRTALGIAVLGLAIALLLPSRYTATVVIMPPQSGGSTSSSAAMMAQMGAMASMGISGGNGIKNPNDLQVAFLKSAGVENAMVERFRLQAEYHRKLLSSARKRWERATTVDNGLKDGLIRLSVTDADPRRAAELANSWVEEYQRFTAKLAVTEASQRRLFYERQLNGAHEDLERAEEEMKQVEQRTGVIDIEGQDRTLIATAAVLRGQVAAKQIEIKAMREFAADRNPDLERAEQQLTGLEGQLAAMDAASDRKTGDLVAPKGKVTEAALDYARALREVKYRETIYEMVMRQYEGARMDEARQGSMVQIVDPASVPDRPSSLYRIWIAIGSLLAALPLALIAARVADLFARAFSIRRRFGSWAAVLGNGGELEPMGQPVAQQR